MKLIARTAAVLLLACSVVALAEPARASNTAAQNRQEPRLSAPGEDAMGDLILQAMSLMGIAYRFGGNSPTQGFDCSGFIRYIFEKSAGVNMPRTAAEQARLGVSVGRDELRPGDMVFFNTRGFANSHVGLYIGNNKFIHAPRTGKNIEIVNMSSGYWASRYNGARRVARGAGNVSSAELLDDLGSSKKRDSGGDAIARFSGDGETPPPVRTRLRKSPDIVIASSAVEDSGKKAGKNSKADDGPTCPPPKKGLSAKQRKQAEAECRKAEEADKKAEKKAGKNSKADDGPTCPPPKKGLSAKQRKQAEAECRKAEEADKKAGKKAGKNSKADDGPTCPPPKKGLSAKQRKQAEAECRKAEEADKKAEKKAGKHGKADDGPTCPPPKKGLSAKQRKQAEAECSKADDGKSDKKSARKGDDKKSGADSADKKSKSHAATGKHASGHGDSKKAS